MELRRGNIGRDHVLAKQFRLSDRNITVTRLVEEGNFVIAEGSVKARPKDGNKIDAVLCDVFHFTNGKISKLTTYRMFNKQP